MGYGMPERVRCFVALELPEELRDEIEKVASRLREAGAAADVRWTRPEVWHLTLKFIGEAERERLGEFTGAVGKAAAECAPATVRFGAPVLFPSGGAPRVVAIGIEDAGEPDERGRRSMERLALTMEDALDPLGVAREGRRFRPHLTLGRIRGSLGLERLGEGIRREAETDLGEVAFDEVVFLMSELGKGAGGGPRYTVLARSRLAGEA